MDPVKFFWRIGYLTESRLDVALPSFAAVRGVEGPERGVEAPDVPREEDARTLERPERGLDIWFVYISDQYRYI